MRLGDKQKLFSRLIAEHIVWLYEKGYSVSFGDAYRDPRVHGGVGVTGKMYGTAYSCHKSRLALDLNLFYGGNYLKESHEHAESGTKWESRHKLCCWGGRFNDGNHYSMTHEGRK